MVIRFDNDFVLLLAMRLKYDQIQQCEELVNHSLWIQSSSRWSCLARGIKVCEYNILHLALHHAYVNYNKSKSPDWGTVLGANPIIIHCTWWNFPGCYPIENPLCLTLYYLQASNTEELHICWHFNLMLSVRQCAMKTVVSRMLHYYDSWTHGEILIWNMVVACSWWQLCFGTSKN
jgi:hypothetical protein